MADAISNTSPLLYLHHIGGLHWLPVFFGQVFVPTAVVNELGEGARRGFDVPDLDRFPWIQRAQPRSMPSQWLALDLGPGELAAMALALENPGRVLLLDDALARRTALAAGLSVWGTLKVLLETKTRGLIVSVNPLLRRLEETGMWIGDDVRQRILKLAGE